MSDMQFSIRLAQEHDAAAIAEIYNEAIRTTTATFDTEPRSVENRRQWLAQHDKRHPVWVAEVDGNVVGWASITAWSDRPAYNDTGETSFYVAENHRGRGIGRELKSHVISEAQKLGYHTLLARTAQDSVESIHLNESFGFQHVGTMKQVGLKFGRRLDVHVMQLMLEDSSRQCQTQRPPPEAIVLVAATVADVPLLASMNKRLIVDEQSRNPMSIAELEERMAGWVAGDWQAVLIQLDGRPVGYILSQIRGDEFVPSQASLYVRQFFIDREHRRQGIGQKSFEQFLKQHAGNIPSVVLDVLESNFPAREFWESLGFRPYCTTMILQTCRINAAPD